MDKDVMLHPHSAIFVTMNPAGTQYGGRSKLPNNLKQLFRGVSMTYPNNEHISRVLLMAEGFEHGTQLGMKVVKLFEKCTACLSKERHYDWGLRALKSVLGMAGKILRQVGDTQLKFPSRLLRREMRWSVRSWKQNA